MLDDKNQNPIQKLDAKTRTQLQSDAFETLMEHLRARTDVQNIDLMNLSGFCRNCLSRWLQEAASTKGLEITKEDARTYVYGMTYEQWKRDHQK